MNKKNIICTIGILLISCIMVPLLINWLFKQNSFPDFMVVDWTSADALQYAGTVLSFLGTIYLGAITVKLSKDANKLNEKLINIEKERENVNKLELYIQYVETFNKIFEIGLVTKANAITKTQCEVLQSTLEIWDECKRLRQRITLIANDDTEYVAYLYFEQIIKTIEQIFKKTDETEITTDIVKEIKDFENGEYKTQVKNFIMEAERNLRGGQDK